MTQLPLTGWTKDVYPSLIRLISTAAANTEVSEFYIGRTNDLTATKSRHGCDDIYVLYETKSADNAIFMENALIKTFHGHDKCNNDNNHGGGRISDDYIQCVYLACWF